MSGLTRPVALSWRRDQLWISDWRPQSTSVLVVAAGGEYGFGTTESGAIVTRNGNGAPTVLLTRPQSQGVYWYQLTNDGSAIERVLTLFSHPTTVHAVLSGADGAVYVCVSDDPGGAARLVRVTGWQ